MTYAWPSSQAGTPSMQHQLKAESMIPERVSSGRCNLSRIQNKACTMAPSRSRLGCNHTESEMNPVLYAHHSSVQHEPEATVKFNKTSCDIVLNDKRSQYAHHPGVQHHPVDHHDEAGERTSHEQLQALHAGRHKCGGCHDLRTRHASAYTTSIYAKATRRNAESKGRRKNRHRSGWFTTREHLHALQCVVTTLWYYQITRTRTPETETHKGVQPWKKTSARDPAHAQYEGRE